MGVVSLVVPVRLSRRRRGGRRHGVAQLGSRGELVRPVAAAGGGRLIHVHGASTLVRTADAPVDGPRVLLGSTVGGLISTAFPESVEAVAVLPHLDRTVLGARRVELAVG